MEGVKIYGLCLERLKHQIAKARQRAEYDAVQGEARIVLECYNTGELDEIIDILELYDVEDRTRAKVTEKLEELAYTVSELLRQPLSFDYTDEGHLGLYLALHEESAIELPEAVGAV